jgi:hypothetical protein
VIRAVSPRERLAALDSGRISISWPQPGRQSSRATTAGILRSSGQAEESLEPSAIKADDRLSVDHGDGSRAIAERLEFLARLRIGSDILFDEGDAFLRKKLFLAFAARSAGLGIDDHLVCHVDPPFASSTQLARADPCPLDMPCAMMAATVPSATAFVT